MNGKVRFRASCARCCPGSCSSRNPCLSEAAYRTTRQQFAQALRRALQSAALAAALIGCHQPTPHRSTGPESEAAGSAGRVGAARAFVAALEDTSRTAALFPFDAPERTTWAYVPQVRAGLPFGRMRPEERSAADALLGTALSPAGVRQATAITQLEATLRTLEEERGQSASAARRDPRLYYVAVFGTPAEDSVWGWRLEGHHLSVNVTSVGRDGQIVAPLFMGANPARVPSGPQAGLRLLADEEDLARALLLSLDSEQRARAVIAEATFGEIVTRNDPKVRPVPVEGLPAAAMTREQQGQLRRLLEVYARRMTPVASRSQLQRIEQAGFGRLHFAWAGSPDPGRAHYYRIHGPTVLVEYDNTQTGANHVHTVWRDLEHDFGGDLLREHYARHSHHR